MIAERAVDAAEENFETFLDRVKEACDGAAVPTPAHERRGPHHSAAAAGAVARNGTDSSPSNDIFDCIRRGEVDAVLGSGPLAGKVLIVKSLQLEEENRRLIEALEKEKQRLEEFAFATAHDLRGPLANIETEIASLLDRQERLRLPLWFADSLRQIELAGMRMRLLVSDLMMLGEATSVSEPVECISLFDVVAAVLDAYRPVLARRRVNVEIVDELPRVRARLRHVEALFDNLIDNAVRYAGTVAKGRVQIGCHELGAELVMWVRDNGPGFDAREAEAVFEPYVRLDKRGDNTGLGLTIVRNAARTHGGRAWIESEPGKGTTAFVALPSSCMEGRPSSPVLP
jgi:signal transduction histidine kinase